MAKFDFQLEGVLRHRKNLEQERQRALAVVQAEVSRLHTELMELDQTVRSANEDMRQNHLTGRLDLNFMAAHRRFLISTQQRASEVIQKMTEVQRQVEEARRALATAAKERKVIEKLRERQHARWAAEINRKETVENDEIGMQLAFANLHHADGGGEL